MISNSLQKTIANRVERRIRGLENPDYESGAFVNSVLASAIIVKCSNDSNFGFLHYQGIAEHDFGYLDKILVNYEVFFFEKMEDLSRFSKENGIETSLELNNDKTSVSVKLLLTKEESSVQQVKDEISYYVPELLEFSPLKTPVIEEKWHVNAEKIIRQMENCPDSRESIRFSCANAVKEMFLNSKWDEICNEITNSVAEKLEKHYGVGGKDRLKKCKDTTIEDIAVQAVGFAVTDERLLFLDDLQTVSTAKWNADRKSYKRIPNDYFGELTATDIQKLSEKTFAFCLKFLENSLVKLITYFDCSYNHFSDFDIRRIVLQTGFIGMDQFPLSQDDMEYQRICPGKLPEPVFFPDSCPNSASC